MYGSPLYSPPRVWTARLYARLRSSIVVRTTLAILLLSTVLGLISAAFVSASVDRREQQRAEVRVKELVATIERTTQIACYLNDRTLAGEIARGLMRNRSVQGVLIASGKTTLFRVGNTTVAGGRINDAEIVRPVHSPFDARDPIGRIFVFVNRAAIHAEARSYSRAATLAMALQVALVAAGAALAVYFFSTRPIRAVSNELHRIRSDSGTRLQAPAGNRHNEIGTLVTDVNALITSLADLLVTERDLRIAHEIGARKMRLIFEKAETGIFVLDTQGMLESWNPAFVRLLRLGPDRLPQAGVTPLQQLLSPQAELIRQLIGQCLASGESYSLDIEMPASEDHRAGWIEVALNPIDSTILQGLMNDITERKQGELSAHELATRDTLTGLLNRRGLEVGLAATLTPRPPESAAELALLQIDLDYFKQVNDSYGHATGDQVLRHVAGVLQRNTRRGDLIARPGGDEFVVALLGIADAAKAEQIAQGIIAEIARPIDIGGQSVCIGASIGIAFTCGQGDSPEAVMRRADAAMYRAKRAGRGQVCLAAAATPATASQTSAVA